MNAKPVLLFAGFLLACNQEVDDTEDTDSEGYEVEVTADGGTAMVDLSTLSTTTLEGDDVVALTEILTASELSVTGADRTYDFVASDGYRPSSKDCGPVDPTTLSGGYLYPASGHLVWDAALDLAGCFFVDGVVTVEVQDPARR